LAGLRSTFGIKTKPEEIGSSDLIRTVLRDVLSQLGIDMNVSGKAVFYNALSGIVMVRATRADLEIVHAAIETLGGSVSSQSAAETASGGLGGAMPYDEWMRQRYGLSPRGK
jgi:hypothetical protein